MPRQAVIVYASKKKLTSDSVQVPLPTGQKLYVRAEERLTDDLGEALSKARPNQLDGETVLSAIHI